jgi:hypothetical protein
MDASYWDELVGSTVARRKWIAAVEYVGGLEVFAERLVRQGADSLFVLAGGRGTGELPPAGFASWRILDIAGDDIMDGIRKYEAALVDLPADVVAAVDDFDPRRTARVLRTVFAVDHDVAGRPSYGTRPARWAFELEDKTTVDSLWDAAGVPRAPSAVVAADGEALRSAATSLDRGMGTVWSGDNRGGWHGGASHVRWIRDEFDPEVAAFFEKRCDMVRVMPFLDGIPCSIHGMVIGESVIAFRPVELLILRRPGSPRFLYAGAAAVWDPPASHGDAMRAAATEVGAFIRDHHGYRGAFNLDGVMTEDGWLPTEFNARFAAGLATLQRGFDVPMLHLHWNVVEGEDLDYRPHDLERAFLDTVERSRSGGFGAPIEGIEVTQERRAEVVLDAGHYRMASPQDEPDGTVTLGPMASGGYLRFSDGRSGLGPSYATTAAAVMAFADREWGTNTGALEPAPDLR